MSIIKTKFCILLRCVNASLEFNLLLSHILLFCNKANATCLFNLQFPQCKENLCCSTNFFPIIVLREELSDPFPFNSYYESHIA